MATEHSNAGGPDPYPAADALLDKADALLSRHRLVRTGLPPEPPIDYPVLTEIVESPAEAPRSARDVELEEIERKLRLELLDQMAGELERLIEARVHARLSSSIETIISRTRTDLVAEVRRAVRDVLSQVIHDEEKRLRAEAAPNGSGEGHATRDDPGRSS